ncbi:M14 family zinc carboxypeptidase [Promicromonospora kroppenstedtii]|uniref:M14 family zinc carboxypeptidase n=1 Tax=Promicromonospora kroppenstedtii TaxID=440482 RepID=A0ABW7XLK8_9MICO
MLARTRLLTALTGAVVGVTLAVGGAVPATATSGGSGPAVADVRTGPADGPTDPGAFIASYVPPDPVPRGPAEVHMPASYPYQPRLRVFPQPERDATDRNRTASHADLAPRLQRLMERSDRVSTQVVGQSTEGRDLYLVTVTAPESAAETARQAAWREEIRDRPNLAAHDSALRSGYKTPIWMTANIHGDEWEGTDAALRVVDRLATADDRATRQTLARHRIVFSLTLNPDGRTHATRPTSLGLDANRDMITLATPEARSYVRTLQAVQPLLAADFHGYTGVLQLEPAGPPHGENYEYDLLLPHGYAIARQVEDDVVAADIAGNTYYDPGTGRAVEKDTGFVKIPYRDTPSGWDDYPPVFTAQYAALHGAVTTTVELPLGRTGATTTPADSAVDTEVAVTAMTSMIDYVHRTSDAMLAGQVETFRRGVAGAPKVALTTRNVAHVPGPDEWKRHWGTTDDQEPVRLPRAYVIPVGEDQRSSSDAEDLVDTLLFHGIEVGRLDAPARVPGTGTTYPAGSYVVDLHQPLRGLANSLLGLGSDISAKVPGMYDISAWSLAELWGATVDPVGVTTDGPVGRTTLLHAPVEHGGVVPHERYLRFDLAGVADHRALNDLLGQDVDARLTADGGVVVGPDGRGPAVVAAGRYGIDLGASTRAEYRSAEPAEDLTIAYVGDQDDRLALTALGFDDLVAVSAGGIGTSAAVGRPTGLEGADVLWVGTTLDLPPGTAGHEHVRSWLRDGGAIVGRGAGAFAAAKSFGLVSGTAVTGDEAGNGIIETDTPGDVLGDHPQDRGFVYPAVWFTDVGPGTTAELTYGSFLAGHWSSSGRGPGPEAASGRIAAVSGKIGQARAFVFGTSVFFRTHPRGGLSQAGTAIHWAAG